MANFFEDFKSSYIGAPEKHDFMGLIQSTVESAIAGTAGRYVYDKFVGNMLTKYLGNVFGEYVNIGSSAIYSLVLNYLSERFVGNQNLSNMLQLAGSIPISDYIAKALGDPLGPGLVKSNPASGMDAEDKYIDSLIKGGAPSVSMSSTEGY